MNAISFATSGMLRVSFTILALTFSIFHGVMARVIFGDSPSTKRWAWHLHQFWLNFCGSVAGWVACWFLLQKILLVSATPLTAAANWSDVGLFFLAFIGVTGYLPYAVVSSIRSIKELLGKIPGLGKS